jgi:ferric-dicitrate binding protein FerR (iron transport regulator)
VQADGLSERQEWVVSEDRNLAPYFCDDALASEQIQTMARRQFAASAVVGLAFMAAAAMIGMRSAQAPAPAAPQATAHSETRVFGLAQPLHGGRG